VAGAIADLQHAANRRISAALPLPFAVPTPEHLRIRRARSRLRAVLDDLVDERRRRGPLPEEQADVLDLLLDARDDRGDPLPRELVYDELVTLLIAGHESTSNALSWAFYLLATHPAEARLLRAEIDEVLGDGELTPDHVTRLPRARAVIEETMRLYPPAWSFGHAPVRDDVLGGFPVPAGRLIMIVPWATHRDAATFPDPEAFDPSRFLGREPAPFSYLPFGGGPHTCIGHQFARIEAQIALVAWMRALHFELVPGQDVEPLPLITLRPREGLLMAHRKRRE
jgi:cytochrome P450